MNKSRRTPLKKALIILNIVALLGFAGGMAYFYFENRDLNEKLTLTDEQKRDKLVTEIDEVFDLPDEQPEVVIVTDPEKFKTEYTTFENVENGDYLLVFRKARLGVLYRQDEKRVVKTTNIVIPIAVELVGSDSAIDSIVEKLTEFGDQITVTRKITTGITQSFVFDVDADQQAETASIAQQLGLTVATTLPSTIIPSAQTEIIVLVADATQSQAPAQP